MTTASIIALLLIGVYILFCVIFSAYGLRAIRCPNNKCRSLIFYRKPIGLSERECLRCGRTLILYPNYSARIKS